MSDNITLGPGAEFDAIRELLARWGSRAAGIGNDAAVLALPRGHALAKVKGKAHLHDLRHTDVLLLDEGHCLRAQALSFCTRAKAHELEFRATSLTTLTQMVAGGAGVT